MIEEAPAPGEAVTEKKVIERAIVELVWKGVLDHCSIRTILLDPQALQALRNPKALQTLLQPDFFEPKLSGKEKALDSLFQKKKNVIQL